MRKGAEIVAYTHDSGRHLMIFILYHSRFLHYGRKHSHIWHSGHLLHSFGIQREVLPFCRLNEQLRVESREQLLYHPIKAIHYRQHTHQRSRTDANASSAYTRYDIDGIMALSG